MVEHARRSSKQSVHVQFIVELMQAKARSGLWTIHTIQIWLILVLLHGVRLIMWTDKKIITALKLMRWQNKVYINYQILDHIYTKYLIAYWYVHLSESKSWNERVECKAQTSKIITPSIVPLSLSYCIKSLVPKSSCQKQCICRQQYPNKPHHNW